MNQSTYIFVAAPRAAQEPAGPANCCHRRQAPALGRCAPKTVLAATSTKLAQKGRLLVLQCVLQRGSPAHCTLAFAPLASMTMDVAEPCCAERMQQSKPKSAPFLYSTVSFGAEARSRVWARHLSCLIGIQFISLPCPAIPYCGALAWLLVARARAMAVRPAVHGLLHFHQWAAAFGVATWMRRNTTGHMGTAWECRTQRQARRKAAIRPALGALPRTQSVA